MQEDCNVAQLPVRFYPGDCRYKMYRFHVFLLHSQDILQEKHTTMQNTHTHTHNPVSSARIEAEHFRKIVQNWTCYPQLSNRASHQLPLHGNRAPQSLKKWGSVGDEPTHYVTSQCATMGRAKWWCQNRLGYKRVCQDRAFVRGERRLLYFSGWSGCCSVINVIHIYIYVL